MQSINKLSGTVDQGCSFGKFKTKQKDFVFVSPFVSHMAGVYSFGYPYACQVEALLSKEPHFIVLSCDYILV